MLTAERFARIQTLRTQSQLHRDIARQNAWTAIRAAIIELNETYDGGRCVSARANICGEKIPEGHAQWTGIWSVTAGKPVFNRWLVSLPEDARFQLDAPWNADGDGVPIFEDIGLADACPRLPINFGGKVVGHFAYWVEDECDKLRVNLPEPSLPRDGILQQFCPPSLGLNSEQVRTLENCLSFSSLHRSPGREFDALFHNLTLCGRGLLKNTAGQWLEDLTLKLQKLPSGPTEYIFPGDPAYPEPPPTFGQIASFFRATESISSFGIAPCAGGPIYRIIYPATNALGYTLGNLPLPELGLNIPVQSGIYPIPVALFMTAYAEVSAGQAIIHLKPTVSIWNPYNAPFAPSTYTFQLLSASPSNAAGTLPGFSVETAAGNTTLVRLGTNEAGIIFQGEIQTGLNAGEVRTFAIDDPSLTLAIPLNLPKEVPAITIQRANSMIGAVSWFNLSMRLLDASGNLLQEISDFVDGDATEAYVVPRDGTSHELFHFCARANLGSGATQWLAHYDPRAPQIRRNTFEHAPLLGLLEPFHRHFAFWSVEFCNSPPIEQFPGFFGDGTPSAILFDLPREPLSIGFLRHVPLTPFPTIRLMRSATVSPVHSWLPMRSASISFRRWSFGKITPIFAKPCPLTTRICSTKRSTTITLSAASVNLPPMDRNFLPPADPVAPEEISPIAPKSPATLSSRVLSTLIALPSKHGSCFSAACPMIPGRGPTICPILMARAPWALNFSGCIF
jgi:hypothetical protein